MNSATNIMFSLFASWSFSHWSVNNRWRYENLDRKSERDEVSDQQQQQQQNNMALIRNSKCFGTQNKWYSLVFYSNRMKKERRKKNGCSDSSSNNNKMLSISLSLAMVLFKTTSVGCVPISCCVEWMLNVSIFSGYWWIGLLWHAICIIAWFAQGVQFLKEKHNSKRRMTTCVKTFIELWLPLSKTVVYT